MTATVKEAADQLTVPTLETTMTVTVTTHLEPAMTVMVTALLESSMTVPVDTMMNVVTVGHPHRSDTATMTVMTVDHRLTATVPMLQRGTGTTAMTVIVTVCPAANIVKSILGRIKMMTFLTAEDRTSRTQSTTHASVNWRRSRRRAERITSTSRLATCRSFMGNDLLGRAEADTNQGYFGLPTGTCDGTSSRLYHRGTYDQVVRSSSPRKLLREYSQGSFRAAFASYDRTGQEGRKATRL
jgi:hypothetical protein